VVDGLKEAVELSHHDLALQYEIGASFCKFTVPKIELFRFSMAFPNQPQEVISLQQNLIVTLQGAQILGVELTIGEVKIAAA